MRTCEFVTITIPTTYHFSPLTWCYGEGSRGGCCFCFSRPCWGYHHPLEGGNPKLRYLPWRADLVSSHMVRIGALAHCDAILGGSHVASVAWNAAPWVFFCWVIFRWAIFCVGRNHLVNGWSKRFNYAYILYIYIHMVDFLFSGKWRFGWGLEKGQKLTSTEVLVVDELGCVHLTNSGRGP